MREKTAPSGDVIRKFLPNDTPSLILMDKLMNYVTRTRKSGLADQFYAFLHNLSEAARGMDRVVLVVSVPASELEMTPSDQEDYDRIKKLLDRVGKPVQISHEKETAEIIRRRLFEWDGVPTEANKIIQEYADWVVEHRQQVPSWFPVDRAREEFKASYPFHPLVISVFERKWRALPRFQQTRGVLRLLALCPAIWNSKNGQDEITISAFVFLISAPRWAPSAAASSGLPDAPWIPPGSWWGIRSLYSLPIRKPGRLSPFFPGKSVHTHSPVKQNYLRLPKNFPNPSRISL
ncbi:MAG: DUF499 domain-containing protein [Methanoregula sp.]|nr:DUF499 domain-containing protein [Methanoregula sp.]